MNANIAVLPGDGIGPDVIAESVKVLKAIENKYNHKFNLTNGIIGGIAVDNLGVALPEETMVICKNSDAVLFGAVGGPKWDDPQAKVRATDGILELRKGLSLFANLRPVKVTPTLVNSTSLKAETVKDVDLLVVRELTGGLYFGQPKKQWRDQSGRHAVDTMVYSEEEIDRIIRLGFELARGRSKKLTSVDKANVLECSRLWRQIAGEISKNYPDIELKHMYVDACAMQLVRSPREFDVIVTSNVFGDILTDEASTLAGSLGMLPSASLAGIPGGNTFGLYEPIHGTAPDIAGKNLANPIATVLSAAMMLRYSFGLLIEAQAVEDAIEATLREGYRTADIWVEGEKKVGTVEMGDLIANKLSG
jgi:3-isopropylmalate dehydrogenase